MSDDGNQRRAERKQIRDMILVENAISGLSLGRIGNTRSASLYRPLRTTTPHPLKWACTNNGPKRPPYPGSSGPACESSTSARKLRRTWPSGWSRPDL